MYYAFLSCLTVKNLSFLARDAPRLCLSDSVGLKSILDALQEKKNAGSSPRFFLAVKPFSARRDALHENNTTDILPRIFANTLPHPLRRSLRLAPDASGPRPPPHSVPRIPDPLLTWAGYNTRLAHRILLSPLCDASLLRPLEDESFGRRSCSHLPGFFMMDAPPPLSRIFDNCNSPKRIAYKNPPFLRADEALFHPWPQTKEKTMRIVRAVKILKY